MGKYEPLARHLSDFTGDAWDATFEQIEEILKSKLPPSARKYQAWWSNATKGGHSQAKSWIDADWVTVPGEIDLREGKIRFARKSRRKDQTQDLDRLRKDAMRISGISDVTELEREALTALIRREAGRQLILMGGTMPDLVVPERERPTW